MSLTASTPNIIKQNNQRWYYYVGSSNSYTTVRNFLRKLIKKIIEESFVQRSFGVRITIQLANSNALTQIWRVLMRGVCEALLRWLFREYGIIVRWTQTRLVWTTFARYSRIITLDQLVNYKETARVKMFSWLLGHSCMYVRFWLVRGKFDL